MVLMTWYGSSLYFLFCMYEDTILPFVGGVRKKNGTEEEQWGEEKKTPNTHKQPERKMLHLDFSLVFHPVLSVPAIFKDRCVFLLLLVFYSFSMLFSFYLQFTPTPYLHRPPTLPSHRTLVRFFLQVFSHAILASYTI